MKSFHYKSLVGALLAAGAASQAGAVNVNQDGLGQHLIYPYYTARSGNTTLLSVVNTTTAGKVVRVRFLEAKNSVDVLDFNLFLSPYDVWTGAVTKNVAGDGARLITNDNSCTSPTKDQWTSLGGGAYSVDMFNFLYASEDPAAPQGLDRTFEGYVEIIEQASVPLSTTGLYLATKHDATGVAPCTAAVVNATSDTSTAVAAWIAAPTGGMFGALTLLGPVGTSTSVNATALDNFARLPFVNKPSSAFPNFSDGNSCVAATTVGNEVILVNTALANGGVCTPTNQARASMVALMADTINGEYSYTGKVGSPLGTDWIITHPGKNFLTQVVAQAPFTTPWSKTAKTACETIEYRSFDREEFGSSNPSLPNCFSGSAEGACQTKSTSLCFEANVVSFGEGPGISAAVQSANTLWLSGTQQLGANSTATKDGGWMTMDLGPRSGSSTSIAAPGRRLPGQVVSATNIITGAASVANPVGSTATFVGLPVIGFSVSGVKVTAGPQLNNYGASVSLTPTRRISAAQ